MPSERLLPNCCGFLLSSNHHIRELNAGNKEIRLTTTPKVLAEKKRFKTASHELLFLEATAMPRPVT